MPIKIAINGFGRIGRCVARIIQARQDLELVAINDMSDPLDAAYLYKYDSVHGIFDAKVEAKENALCINDKEIAFLKTRDIKELDFAKYGANLVLECTGVHLSKALCENYIKKGIKKVIMSAPAKDDTPTFVLGVNHHKYKGEAIISNASCTTNCLGPICRVLQDEFGINKGLMSTIHAYTNGQALIDSKAGERRRSRAAAINLIPTSTGAAKAMKLVMPELDGKLHGQSVRVPVANVSMVDLSVLLAKKTSKEAINEAFYEASQNKLKNIMLVDFEKRVSSDFLGSAYGCIIAADLTQLIADDFAKIMAWYDNEWAYSTRLLDLASFIMES